MLSKIWTYLKIKEIFSWITAKLKTFTLREWFLLFFSIFMTIAAIQIYCTDRTKIIAIEQDAATYKNKADEEYKAKTILIQDVANLKKRNDSISAEYEKIKNQDPLVITKTQIVTKIDTVIVPTYIIKENGTEYYTLKWDYNEKTNDQNYFTIDGQTRVDSTFTNASTTINNMEIGMDLKLDVVKSQADNAMRIIARSDNPRVVITDIEGAIINPTENKTIKSYFPTKHWGLGIHVGLGGQYGINNKKFSFGPEIGIGISYNILTW